VVIALIDKAAGGKGDALHGAKRGQLKAVVHERFNEDIDDIRELFFRPRRLHAGSEGSAARSGTIASDAQILPDERLMAIQRRRGLVRLDVIREHLQPEPSANVSDNSTRDLRKGETIAQALKGLEHR
jgi:hypothetical protein